jgi:hypothetical protein
MDGEGGTTGVAKYKQLDTGGDVMATIAEPGNDGAPALLLLVLPSLPSDHPAML